MPNWCYNKLIVSTKDPDNKDFSVEDVKYAVNPSGRKKPENEAERIMEALDTDFKNSPVLSFETILPTPEEDLSDDGWYDWRIENWGTKWDVDEPVLFEGDAAQNTMGEIALPDECLVYLFNTAWSPPIEWVQELSRKFRDAVFHLVYVDEMDNFSGVNIIYSGMIFDVSSEKDLEELLEDYGMDIHGDENVPTREEVEAMFNMGKDSNE